MKLLARAGAHEVMQVPHTPQVELTRLHLPRTAPFRGALRSSGARLGAPSAAMHAHAVDAGVRTLAEASQGGQDILARDAILADRFESIHGSTDAGSLPDGGLATDLEGLRVDDDGSQGSESVASGEVHLTHGDPVEYERKLRQRRERRAARDAARAQSTASAASSSPFDAPLVLAPPVRRTPPVSFDAATADAPEMPPPVSRLSGSRPGSRGSS